jgi:hypothetical protein
MRRVIFLLGITLLLLVQSAQAQIQIGTAKGTVRDPTGALVANAIVTLDNALTGFNASTTTGPLGEYVFNNVPFGSYTLRVSAAGFQADTAGANIRSNIPITTDFKLGVAGVIETLNVVSAETLVQVGASGTSTTLDETFIGHTAGTSRQLQNVIATTPGWRVENDGLLHVRGVDDGFLYVVDGVPMADRIDVVSGNTFDTETIRSLNVMTGNIPAEFGGRSGAVVAIQSKSVIGTSFTGALSLGGGGFNSRQINANLGGGFTEKLGLLVNFFGKRSDHFLDPVDPGNFNNRGATLGLHVRTDWQPTVNDSILFTFAAGGTDFHITNDHEQEIAGQRQRQELRDNRQSLQWQRLWSSSTVTDLAVYRQSNSSNLYGSSFDTPLFASQDRSASRLGIVGSLTRSLNDHVFKLGFDASRVSLNEFFTFAVTDEDEAEEVDISEVSLEFDRRNPFLFRDRNTREQFSAYAQDSFSPFANFTVNAGVRFDYSNLPVSEQQFSPRLGVVYFIPKSKTALRGSFDRLYMPAQVENLLLASSEEARRLSPFATPQGGGSALVRAERVSAWELGFAQDVFGIMSIDAAYWSRSFRNYADPNVFFNTTIIFPNSVAEGFARGVDVRLDVPERKGWSGYVSYGNARIVQTGPINGGLFLTDEVMEIGPGTRFTPDQDVRNTASFGLTYQPRSKGFWLSLGGRHESGVPLEVDEDELDDLRERTGADLVNFERGRVKPWTLFDLAGGFELFKEKRVAVQTQFSVENIANKRFVYNFGNPFSGTHFGHPRMLNARVKFVFR